MSILGFSAEEFLVGFYALSTKAACLTSAKAIKPKLRFRSTYTYRDIYILCRNVKRMQ
jgi:hypothetical protein